MKKAIAVVTSLLVLCLALTGCGGSSDTTTASQAGGDSSESGSVVGTWVLDTMIDGDGNEITVEEYAKANGVDASTLECTMTFTDDGKVTQEVAGVSADCTYTVSGDTVGVTYQGVTADYTYDSEDDILYYVNPDTGATSVLVRK